MQNLIQRLTRLKPNFIGYKKIIMAIISFTDEKRKRSNMPKKTDTHWNKEFAKTSEGEVRFGKGQNHKLYECPAGKLTIGWGYNIEDHGLDDHIAEMLLNQALNNSQGEASRLVKNWNDLIAPRKSVLIDMAYNMGITKLKQFKKMIAAIEKEDWKEAAAQMKDSAWYKQVGNRSKVLHKMMLSGEYPK